MLWVMLVFFVISFGVYIYVYVNDDNDRMMEDGILFNRYSVKYSNCV